MSTYPAALDGIRILECTDSLGIYAGKLFADLGADVIRIEPPGGDPIRRKGSFVDDKPHPNGGLYHLYMNTSKQSLTLDVTHPKGQELLLRLAARSHAIIETVPDGVHGLLGLDPEQVLELHPHLVYTRISPYGTSGPYAGYQATDLTLTAAGGLMSLAGEPDRAPLAPAGEQASIVAGLHAAVATLIALYHAEATGEGQLVDLSVQESLATCLETAIQYFELEGTVRKRVGGRHRESGTGLFRCRDGYIYMMAGRLSTARGWAALVRWLNEEGVPGAHVLAQPEWSEYSYRTRPESVEYFTRLFQDFCKDVSRDELYQQGQQRGIVICPVNTPLDLVSDEQLLARGYFVDVYHEEFQRMLRYPGAPYRLSATPWRIRRPAPAPGQDNDHILDELGLSPTERQALVEEGVLRCR